MSEQTQYRRPFLKWAGNKYRVLPEVLRHLPKGERLVEPFVGSGAVFLNSDHPAYLLMDINQDIINLYQQLKINGHAFIDYCETFFTATNNKEKSYYQLRDYFNAHREIDQERAALFFYLNRHGYNGLCRYNSSGLFNVPFGRYEKPYFPKDEMLYFHEKSQRATLLCTDFLTSKPTLLKKGDVCYCDPPYVPLSNSASFTRYAKEDFGIEQQHALAQRARQFAQRGIPVLISNHDTIATRELYQQATLHSFPVARTISRDGLTRKPVQELLALFE